MNRWRRLSFWLWSLPLLLVMLIVLATSFSVSTATGLNSLLALAQWILPGQFSYGRIEGRLIGPLQIEQFRYEDGPLQVTLAKGELDWQPGALLNSDLEITRLQIEGLEVRLPPSEESAPASEPFTLPDIQLPVAVHIADLQGRNLRIKPDGIDPMVIDTIHLQARTGTEGLRIEVLEARSPLGDVRLSGQVNPVGDYPLQLQLTWRLPTPNYGNFHGQGQIRGALRERLELTQQVSGAAALELTGDVHELFTEPAWSVQAKLNVADLKPFVAELAGQPLTAQVEAQGVMARFKGKGSINATLPDLGPTTLHFTAAGDEQA
ncbi:MAG: hypothetical protein WAW42_01500, partial [Candidatus Competibacteraceae bacterium]